ncbi:MAG: UbiD family decarboxylase [Deltaproteobacteria bacterium]|jgi:4-hydroxy-3-polyprenylbenzoate decarboxylase|nr:UbiD family decarboxylase [Deltaproteobacteria bacterium]
MSYQNLAACLADLEKNGFLRRINDYELDPQLEAAAIQRRAFRAGSPALLFSRVRGTPFPVLANFFGSGERLRFIFRHGLRAVEALLKLKADPREILRHPLRCASLPRTLLNMLPRKVRTGPVLSCSCAVSRLPQIVSWPGDGGAYITLPQVYSEDPDKPGFFASNLGMYRVQLSGKAFEPDSEVGLHYQIHRGIGPHHAAALAKGLPLPVNVFVGGPPALTMAAIMPLPEGVPEIFFAGALAGGRIAMIMPEPGSNALPMPAQADFCLSGELLSRQGKALVKPEGPFGDHLGYYSLVHDFPVLRVRKVYHRRDAVWPFTSVGRPPQEDTVFGSFIHELTSALVPATFPGVREVHAVDAAGVHPLLLALGSERYVPFAQGRIPQELLTCGFALLGGTQTSLSKYLLMAAKEDAPALSTRSVPDFLAHFLARTDFSRDLHFITRTTMDTLDYTGISLNQGSKLLWAAAGRPLRRLSASIPLDLSLPPGFAGVRLFAPGILVCQGPGHLLGRDVQDPVLESLALALEGLSPRRAGDLAEEIALLVVVDNAEFASASWDNFLWTTFTRSDPATDLYGPRTLTRCKHWSCAAPLIIDARAKLFHAPVLEDDPEVERRIEALAAPGRPLHGLI